MNQQIGFIKLVHLQKATNDSFPSYHLKNFRQRYIGELLNFVHNNYESLEKLQNDNLTDGQFFKMIPQTKTEYKVLRYL